MRGQIPKDKLQPVRGMRDMNYRPHDEIYKVIRDVAAYHNYQEILLPIVEHSEIWQLLGDNSDVVNKEMYTFEDRGGRILTLRPEFTASTVRSFISNNVPNPAKLFTIGPVFRYERPQKGRYRQFYQASFEYFGCSDKRCNGLHCDIETIVFLAHILSCLGIADTSLLHINVLCDEGEMAKYLKDLKLYLNKHKDELSDISKQRLEKNPLRIFDSKDEGDQEIMSKAPKCYDYLGKEKREYYELLLKALNNFITPVNSNNQSDESKFITNSDNGAGPIITRQLKYRENYKIVRGLDYYTSVVFEVTNELLEGAQNVLAAGGRYDNLVKDMSGGDRNVPAIGFAVGIDRVIEVMEKKFNDLSKRVNNENYGDKLMANFFGIDNIFYYHDLPFIEETFLLKKVEKFKMELMYLAWYTGSINSILEIRKGITFNFEKFVDSNDDLTEVCVAFLLDRLNAIENFRKEDGWKGVMNFFPYDWHQIFPKSGSFPFVTLSLNAGKISYQKHNFKDTNEERFKKLHEIHLSFLESLYSQ